VDPPGERRLPATAGIGPSVVDCVSVVLTPCCAVRSITAAATGAPGQRNACRRD
jgi:hypothetical protein